MRISRKLLIKELPKSIREALAPLKLNEVMYIDEPQPICEELKPFLFCEQEKMAPLTQLVTAYEAWLKPRTLDLHTDIQGTVTIPTIHKGSRFNANPSKAKTWNVCIGSDEPITIAKDPAKLTPAEWEDLLREMKYQPNHDSKKKFLLYKDIPQNNRIFFIKAIKDLLLKGADVKSLFRNKPTHPGKYHPLVWAMFIRSHESFEEEPNTPSLFQILLKYSSIDVNQRYVINPGNFISYPIAYMLGHSVQGDFIPIQSFSDLLAHPDLEINNGLDLLPHLIFNPPNPKVIQQLILSGYDVNKGILKIESEEKESERISQRQGSILNAFYLCYNSNNKSIDKKNTLALSFEKAEREAFGVIFHAPQHIDLTLTNELGFTALRQSYLLEPEAWWNPSITEYLLDEIGVQALQIVYPYKESKDISIAKDCLYQFVLSVLGTFTPEESIENAVNARYIMAAFEQHDVTITCTLDILKSIHTTKILDDISDIHIKNLLNKAGFDLKKPLIETQDFENMKLSPLSFAAHVGNKLLAQVLLMYPDVCDSEKKDQKAIMIAIFRGQLRIIHILLKHINYTDPKEIFKTVIMTYKSKETSYMHAVFRVLLGNSAINRVNLKDAFITAYSKMNPKIASTIFQFYKKKIADTVDLSSTEQLEKVLSELFPDAAPTDIPIPYQASLRHEALKVSQSLKKPQDSSETIIIKKSKSEQNELTVSINIQQSESTQEEKAAIAELSKIDTAANILALVDSVPLDTDEHKDGYVRVQCEMAFNYLQRDKNLQKAMECYLKIGRKNLSNYFLRRGDAEAKKNDQKHIKSAISHYLNAAQILPKVQPDELSRYSALLYDNISSLYMRLIPADYLSAIFYIEIAIKFSSNIKTLMDTDILMIAKLERQISRYLLHEKKPDREKIKNYIESACNRIKRMPLTFSEYMYEAGEAFELLTPPNWQRACNYYKEASETLISSLNPNVIIDDQMELSKLTKLDRMIEDDEDRRKLARYAIKHATALEKQYPPDPQNALEQLERAHFHLKNIQKRTPDDLTKIAYINKNKKSITEIIVLKKTQELSTKKSKLPLDKHNTTDLEKTLHNTFDVVFKSGEIDQIESITIPLTEDTHIMIRDYLKSAFYENGIDAPFSTLKSITKSLKTKIKNGRIDSQEMAQHIIRVKKQFQAKQKSTLIETETNADSKDTLISMDENNDETKLVTVAGKSVVSTMTGSEKEKKDFSFPLTIEETELYRQLAGYHHSEHVADTTDEELIQIVWDNIIPIIKKIMSTLKGYEEAPKSKEERERFAKSYSVQFMALKMLFILAGEYRTESYCNKMSEQIRRLESVDETEKGNSVLMYVFLSRARIIRNGFAHADTNDCSVAELFELRAIINGISSKPCLDPTQLTSTKDKADFNAKTEVSEAKQKESPKTNPETRALFLELAKHAVQESGKATHRDLFIKSAKKGSEFIPSAQKVSTITGVSEAKQKESPKTDPETRALFLELAKRAVLEGEKVPQPEQFPKSAKKGFEFIPSGREGSVASESVASSPIDTTTQNRNVTVRSGHRVKPNAANVSESRIPFFRSDLSHRSIRYPQSTLFHRHQTNPFHSSPSAHYVSAGTQPSYSPVPTSPLFISTTTSQTEYTSSPQGYFYPPGYPQ